MKREAYLGHESQLYGVEEHRLVGGKGDGMRLFEVKNGLGLELTVSADRCADIARLSYKGVNFGYFSPCGYVAPAYYDHLGLGFLKSFTAGFLTTCGLTVAGAACEDEGVALGLHGNISHTPAEQIYYTIEDDTIRIHAVMQDSQIFVKKLELHRDILISLTDNHIEWIDTVKNKGTSTEPLMLLYHINFGYPLLTERAQLSVPASKTVAANARAQEGIDSWDKMLAPQDSFEEQCYFHHFSGDTGSAELYNPDLKMGAKLTFPLDTLGRMIEWKMMQKRDYVLGLEPANCHSLGRNLMRESGELQYIAPGEEKIFRVRMDIIEK